MTNSERLALVLIVLGVLSRLVPHPPNMTAVVGVSLLGAYAIRNGWLAALVPLATMALADIVLGWHSSALFTYAGMLAGTLIGRWLLPKLSVLRLGGAAFLASLAFFVTATVEVPGYFSDNAITLLPGRETKLTFTARKGAKVTQKALAKGLKIRHLRETY